MNVSLYCPNCGEQRDFLHIEGRNCVCTICGYDGKTTPEIAFIAEYRALPENKKTLAAIRKLAGKFRIKIQKAKQYARET